MRRPIRAHGSGGTLATRPWITLSKWAFEHRITCAASEIVSTFIQLVRAPFGFAPFQFHRSILDNPEGQSQLSYPRRTALVLSQGTSAWTVRVPDSGSHIASVKPAVFV